MSESWFPMLMLPRVVILLLILFIWTSEWVTCFLASFGSREIGTMPMEHPESNIATPENAMALTIKVALTSGNRCKESFWRLNMWWLRWKNVRRAIASLIVRIKNPVPRCLWMGYPHSLLQHGPETELGTIWTVAYVKASEAPCIVCAYGGFCVVVVRSVRLIIITAVFAGAALLRVRWPIIWSWWLFWFCSSIYSTRSLWSTGIIRSVMWGHAVHFYTSINTLLGFESYANRSIVAVHYLDKVRVYVCVPIFDFLAHQDCAHHCENHWDSQVDLVVLLIFIFYMDSDLSDGIFESASKVR